MTEEFSAIDKFVKKWNKNESLTPGASKDISDVEQSLNITLPSSYKYLVTRYGDIYAPDLLDAIVDEEYDLNDLQNFELPTQALKDTKAWQETGLPPGFYAFASDCMGNMFCFKNSECQSENQEPPIWFFDHDFVEIEKIAENLTAWLDSYNEI